jgi:Flp pilus assembly protein TadG
MTREIMKNLLMPRWWNSFLVDQNGAIGVVIAILLPILLVFAGLSLDIGHVYMVNTQLKNAADAGAVAGARGLVPYAESTVGGQTVYAPKWLNGTTEAQKAVAQNSADNHLLSISTANPGDTPPALGGSTLLSKATPCYWNLNTKTMKSTAATPVAFDVPAMHVMVSKTDGQNNGKINMWLASILGVPSAAGRGESVAMISFNTGMPAGGLKPMVATKTIVDKYWEKYDPTNPTAPFQFKLGDGTTAEDTMWSTFKVVDNSDAYTKQLIEQGNPTPLSIGDSIHLQPGVRAVDYGPNEMGAFINQTVMLPIVDPSTLVANTEAPILGFIAFHITGYNQGGKYIEGYFDKNVISNPYQNITGLPSPIAPTSFNPPQLVY